MLVLGDRALIVGGKLAQSVVAEPQEKRLMVAGAGATRRRAMASKKKRCRHPKKLPPRDGVYEIPGMLYLMTTYNLFGKKPRTDEMDDIYWCEKCGSLVAYRFLERTRRHERYPEVK